MLRKNIILQLVISISSILSLQAEVITAEDTPFYGISIEPSTAGEPTNNSSSAPTSAGRVSLSRNSDGVMADGNNAVYTQKISDHALTGKMVDGVPVYSWNILAYTSPNGFGPSFQKTDAQFRARLTLQAQLISELFKADPHAVVCLQEFTNDSNSAYHKLLALELKKQNSNNLTFQFNKSLPGNPKFGLVTVYDKSVYDVVDAGNNGGQYSPGASRLYQSRVSNQQSNRVLKVVVRNKSTQQLLSIVNGHLVWGDPNMQAVLDELIAYATIQNGTAVITGDFNTDISRNRFQAPKVTGMPAGISYSWDRTNNSPKQNITDGFIIVTP